MADPYLAVTLDAKRRIARVARALELPPAAMGWGFLELLEHVWERKNPAVSALVLAACFGPDPRIPGGLVEFGFLVARGSAWELCSEEADRLLLTHKQRVDAGRARAASADRSAGGQLQPKTSGQPAADQRPASGGPALTPSTQHPAQKDLPRAGARAEPSQGADQTMPSGLGDAMEAEHQRARGRPLDWGPPRHRLAQERAIGDLAAQHGEAEVLRRLRNALTVPRGKFPYLGAVGDLVKHWGQYQEPFPAEGGQRTVRELSVGRGEQPAIDRSKLGSSWAAVLDRMREDGKAYGAQLLEQFRERAVTPAILTLLAATPEASDWFEANYRALAERYAAPRKVVVLVEERAGPEPPRPELVNGGDGTASARAESGGAM